MRLGMDRAGQGRAGQGRYADVRGYYFLPREKGER